VETLRRTIDVIAGVAVILACVVIPFCSHYKYFDTKYKETGLEILLIMMLISGVVAVPSFVWLSFRYGRTVATRFPWTSTGGTQPSLRLISSVLAGYLFVFLVLKYTIWSV
jgi:hypothetical protein